MKNLVSFIFLLALLVSGCSKEELAKHSSSASGEGRIFTTSFENNDSRTYVENGLYSRWTEGDRISLFDASTLNCQYLFAGDTGDKGGTFFMLSKPEGTGTGLSTNYAVYPYNKDMTISTDGAITLTLPSEQHYAENSFGLGDNTMVAVTENADDTFLSFKNVGGCLKFQLYGDDVTVKSITLKGNAGEKIAGKATLVAAYDAIPVVSMTDDATTSITLDCGEKGVKIGSSAEDATSFWVVVPPTSFEKGITIVVKDTDNKVFTQTTDKLLAIERNVVKPMAAVKVEPKLPQLAYSADEEILEGWSTGLFGGEGTYVMGKPHGENGYMMTIGNVLDNESAIVYMDKSKQVREIFVNNTIIAFGEYTNEGVDVFIIEKGGIEKVEHISLNVNSRRSRSSDDHGQLAGSIDLVLSLKDLYEITTDAVKNGGFSKNMVFEYIGTKIEFINNLVRAAGGPDLLGEFWGEVGPWLDKGQSLVDLGELASLYKAVEAGGGKGGLAGAVIAIYANLLSTGLEIYDEQLLATYGNCQASIANIEYKNNTLNIDVNVSGYETTNSELECGVIVKKSNSLVALPAGRFPSNAETKMVTGNGNYSFSVGGIEEDQGYWCYPFVVEINRASMWIGFIGDYAGPLVRYGKAVKYKPESDELREALIKLYESTNGDNWKRNENWCSDKPIMEWYGIRKDLLDENNIIIDLINNGLTGKIDQTFPGEKSFNLLITGNQLTSVNVSGSTSMRALLAYDMKDQLSSLDVSGCTALESLYCQGNQLSSLNVSGCTTLKFLICQDNQLSSLDVSGCTALTNLEFDNNPLTSLDVSDTSLERLFCSNTQLTSLTVNGGSILKYLFFQNSCSIISLNVSGCTALESLDCQNNQLSSLDVSGCTVLRILNCRDNQLTSLDVSGCTALESLLCRDNQLSSLDVSSCTALKSLEFDNNPLTFLDVSDTSLERLLCSNAQFTSLTINGGSTLKYLNFNNNLLTSLNVSGCTSLKDLYCPNNQLTSLDVSGCSALETLNCYNNQLSSLDVSGCTSLKDLKCNNNQLTSLNVSGCTLLEHLSCHNNNITSVIPGWFSQLEIFGHDERYRYWKESVPDGDGGYVTITRSEDRGIGWWYPGEPAKGEHTPN